MSLVEYHDPDNLFPLLSPGLFARLPLRNLNWKSPSRPLRAISSLHVEFQPDNETQELRAQVEGTNSVDLESEPKNASQKSSLENIPPLRTTDVASRASAKKRRRHQIPGLRHTPYLKIYLLKCDDSEVYKSTSRKLLREWIKENSREYEGAASKNKQENHDAFEWLILHVVLPDTPAAGQPRWSKPSGTESELKEKSVPSKWPGRSSGTILEKIRADFNESTKSAPDRVAQIRLQKDTLSSSSQEAGSSTIGSAYVESPQESGKAWSDLINKFKSQILMSFDLRVRQYEEDLREKEAQRTLPGWNFCTFFVLKEGLARAFESVGLLEDALAGYDELSAGLDSIIRSDSTDGSEAATSFQSFTADLREQLFPTPKLPSDTESSVDENGTDETVADTVMNTPINSSKKDYRTLILSNNISIFDFLCYIFSRQMALLLRLANVRRSKSTGSGHVGTSSIDITNSRDNFDNAESVENIISLAELCRRSPIFATTMSRIIRQDLLNGASAAHVEVKREDVEVIVSSWAFSAIEQILEETNSTSLHEGSSQKANGSQGQSRNDRLGISRASLPPRQYTYPLASGEVIYENEKFSSSQDVLKDVKPTAKAALGEVAGYRGDLLLLQRKHLERIASIYGWQLHTADTPDWDERVPLTEEGTQSVLANLPLASDPKFRHFLSSYETFEKSYSHLTSQAIHHYTISGRKQSINALLTDLALMKYQDGDFAAAANFFQSVIASYSEQRWNSKEHAVLKKYAYCLKQLHRKDEYVRVMLRIIAKSAAKERVNKDSNVKTDSKQHRKPETESWIDDAAVDDSDYLSELIEYSKTLPYEVAVPMAKYFDNIDVRHQIEHFEDQDGFRISVAFRPLIYDNQFDLLKVRLVDSATGENREIWLEKTGPIKVTSSQLKIWVSSNVTTNGQYSLDKMILQAGKLALIHEMGSKPEIKNRLSLLSSTISPPPIAKRQTVLVYPRNGACNVDITASNRIHIGKPRAMDVMIQCGQNDIERAKLQLRSGSAGLRIRTAEAVVMQGQFSIEDQSKAGLITFGEMSKQSEGLVQITYDLDKPVNEITIRLEFSYVTARGQFVFIQQHQVNVELALDVNVQEIFKDQFLVTKFFIRPSRTVPVYLMDAHLEDSSWFHVRSLAGPSMKHLALAKQPACVSYFITQPSYVAEGKSIQGDIDTSLPLTVDYRSVLEDATSQLVSMFSADLNATPHAKFARLLLPEFDSRVRQAIAVPDYEQFALIGYSNIPSYESLKWPGFLSSLNTSDEKDLVNWLKIWHQDHSKFQLSTPQNDNYTAISPARRLVIDFEIPQVKYLHTASIKPLINQNGRAGEQLLASVGEALAMQIRIRHTRRWDLSKKPKIADQKRFEDKEQNFTYEIHANPDSWIVGGQRRERFSAREDEELVLEKVLVPVRTGHILLPAIEIKLVAADNDGDADAIRTKARALCETDCTSHSDMIRVVEATSSITVGFGQEGHIGRGVAVLESEARTLCS